MKKPTVFIAMLLILSLCTSSVAFATDETIDTEENQNKTGYEYVMGDANMDGVVDSTDYLRVKKAFIGEFNLKGTAYAMADVDYNGIIDSTDYLRIKSAFLGLYEFDESLWDYEEQQPSVNYKTKGVYCAHRMYGTFSNSYCEGFICGNPDCREAYYDVSYTVTIPSGPGIYITRVEDDETEDTAVSSKYDLFLHNNYEVDILEYIDDNVAKTISVDFGDIGTFDVKYIESVDSIFCKHHLYTLVKPMDGIAAIRVKVNAFTGQIYQKAVVRNVDFSQIASFSKSEGLSMAKKYLQGVFEDKNNTYLRGMTVDYLNVEQRNVSDYYFEYSFPIMINGYTTDVKILVIINKRQGIIWWDYEQGEAKYKSNHEWIFGVDKRSIDIDDNLETYKDSITGYEAYIHGVQTRELHCKSVYVTLTSGGTIGADFDCPVYNVYTKEYEDHPYSHQTVVLGVPLKRT